MATGPGTGAACAWGMHGGAGYASPPQATLGLASLQRGAFRGGPACCVAGPQERQQRSPNRWHGLQRPVPTWACHIVAALSLTPEAACRCAALWRVGVQGGWPAGRSAIDLGGWVMAPGALAHGPWSLLPASSWRPPGCPDAATRLESNPFETMTAGYWELLASPEQEGAGSVFSQRARSASDAAVLRRKGHLKEQVRVLPSMLRRKGHLKEQVRAGEPARRHPCRGGGAAGTSPSGPRTWSWWEAAVPLGRQPAGAGERGERERRARARAGASLGRGAGGEGGGAARLARGKSVPSAAPRPSPQCT